MTAFIEPLDLEKVLINVFAGSSDIFLAVAIIAIISMSAYFRMPILATFFFLGVFLLMFSSFITSPIIILFAVIGGVLLGLVVTKVFNN